jgi:LysR family transcriptional regulator, glycine cleavage system transcriptional activator
VLFAYSAAMANQLPPIDCLLAAVAVARHGSFSAAAQELGVTHAAISRRVAGAEAWAGVPLFRRHARGAAQTTDGERLLARVSQGLDLIDRAADHGRKVRRPTTIRLATTVSFASHWLLGRLTSIEATCGGLRIDVVADGRLVDLKTENLDLAVRYGEGGWKGVVATRMFKDDWLVPVVPRSLVQKVSGRCKPQDVAALPLLHDADSGPWRLWCEAHGLPFRGKPKDRPFTHYHLALAGARAGLGAALMNPLLAPLDDGEDMLVMHHLAVKDLRHWFLLRRHGDASDAVDAVAVEILLEARRSEGFLRRSLSRDRLK